MAKRVLVPDLATKASRGRDFNLDVKFTGAPVTVDLNVGPLQERVGEIAAVRWADLLARGKDRMARTQPRLAQSTIERRERRQNQARSTSSLSMRFPGARRVVDLTTPWHESGYLAEGITVERRGRGVDVSLPEDTSSTDGHGRRSAAVDRVGDERMSGLPRGAPKEIEAAAKEFLEQAVGGRPSLASIMRTGRRKA